MSVRLHYPIVLPLFFHRQLVSPQRLPVACGVRKSSAMTPGKCMPFSPAPLPRLILGPACLVVFVLLLLSTTTLAQAPVAPVPAPAAAPQAAVELFEIPSDIQDFKQLIAFVEKIDSLQPSEKRSQQAMITHHRKVARTIVAAAEQFSAKQPSDQDAIQSVYIKLQALSILKDLGEPKVDQQIAQVVAAAEADKRPDMQFLGLKFSIESGFSLWATSDESDKTALLAKIVKHLKNGPPDGRKIDLTMTVVDFLGNNNSEKYALELLATITPQFRSSPNPDIQAALNSLDGIKRRLSLPGNPIQLEGSLLDGSQLDWSTYRGKVVLVDFWATWCQPCRAEVPNILNMYKAYHGKGFEVIGISLDESPEQAEAYIKQNQIPWPTLFSKNTAERVWKHPLVVRYGINGIPRAILVDRDGKVVHMSARGENLERELRRLLGEPLAGTSPRRDDLVQQTSVQR